jgi:hypothetical protein
MSSAPGKCGVTDACLRQTNGRQFWKHGERSHNLSPVAAVAVCGAFAFLLSKWLSRFAGVQLCTVFQLRKILWGCRSEAAGASIDLGIGAGPLRGRVIGGDPGTQQSHLVPRFRNSKPQLAGSLLGLSDGREAAPHPSSEARAAQYLLWRPGVPTLSISEGRDCSYHANVNHVACMRFGAKNHDISSGGHRAGPATNW